MKIRSFDVLSDMRELAECVVELQDFERNIDERMPSGEEIVEGYLCQMQEKCVSNQGEILIVEVDKKIAGYVQILTKVSSGELDDGNLEFGLISDLFVKQAYRGQGLGKALLLAAEKIAIEREVRWLRISVMASNQIARNAYLASGFSELYVDLEKKL